MSRGAIHTRDGVDQPVLNVRQQPFEIGAFERVAGYAAVLILIADQNPAVGPLARDVGFARLLLGLEAVEFLLAVFIGGFPGSEVRR